MDVHVADRPSSGPARQPSPPTRRSPVRERLVFLALPLAVLVTVLVLLWSGGGRRDGVPGSVRVEAERLCSVAPPTGSVQTAGTPELDRCVADWIAILWG